jgi:hypothetical protein
MISISFFQFSLQEIYLAHAAAISAEAAGKQGKYWEMYD